MIQNTSTKKLVHGYDPAKTQVLLTQHEARQILKILQLAHHCPPTYLQVVQAGKEACGVLGIDADYVMKNERLWQSPLPLSFCDLQKNLELLTGATDCIGPDISRHIHPGNPLNGRTDYCPRCTKTYLDPEAIFHDGTPCIVSNNPIWLFRRKQKNGSFHICPCYPACKFSRKLNDEE